LKLPVLNATYRPHLEIMAKVRVKAVAVAVVVVAAEVVVINPAYY
jgi:hypothetical protein